MEQDITGLPLSQQAQTIYDWVEAEQGRTRNQASAVFGISGPKVYDLYALAELPPSVRAAVDAGEVSLSAALREAKEQARAERESVRRKGKGKPAEPAPKEREGEGEPGVPAAAPDEADARLRVAEGLIKELRAALAEEKEETQGLKARVVNLVQQLHERDGTIEALRRDLVEAGADADRLHAELGEEQETSARVLAEARAALDDAIEQRNSAEATARELSGQCSSLAKENQQLREELARAGRAAMVAAQAHAPGHALPEAAGGGPTPTIIALGPVYVR